MTALINLQITDFSKWVLSGLADTGSGLSLSPSWFGQVNPVTPNGYADTAGGYGVAMDYMAADIAAQTGRRVFAFGNPYKGIDGYGSSAGAYGGGAAEYASASLLKFAQGTAQSPDMAIADGTVALGQIIWEASTPPGTVFNVSASYDAGMSWHSLSNGSWWPGMIQNAPPMADKVRFKVVMSTTNPANSPVLSFFGAYILPRVDPPITIPPLPLVTNNLPALGLPDFVARIKALLPRSWLSAQSPVADGVITACAYPLWAVYSQIRALRDQARIATASGEMLDIAAYDFHGVDLPRLENETDGSYSARIRRSVFQPSSSRQAILSAVEGVTGRPAQVIELTRPLDTGGYGGGAGYAAGGRWGSMLSPYAVLVDALRPINNNLPAIPGYGHSPLAYGLPSGGAYFDIGLSQTGDDALIMAAINRVKPAGVQAFVRIQSSPQQRGPFLH